MKFTTNDLYAVLSGIVDGVLVAKAPLVFIAKNIIIAFLALFDIVKVPEGWRYASLSALGLIVVLYVLGKLEVR